MQDLKQQITETEKWLREHPNADWEARHDMIAKLKELKELTEKLTTTKQQQDEKI